MCPLNQGPLVGARMMTPGPMGPPVPQFGARPPVPPPGGMRPRMPPPPAMHGPMLGPMHGTMMRQWLPPPPGSMPIRPGMMPPRPPPMFGPRGPGGHRPPMWSPMMAPRHMMGPGIRPRAMMPGRIPPHIRPRFPNHNHNGLKIKSANSTKKATKIEEMALKKPWMTDEIRNEIQKKNKLYAKASKNKDAKEWEEFKDLRNKVTRMIRDAKNEYNSKNPSKGKELEDEDEYEDEDKDEDEEEEEMEEEGVEANQYYYENAEDADFYNYSNHEGTEKENPTEEVKSNYCEVCDRDFPSKDRLQEHIDTHEVCGVDGCAFTAHPKLIEKHYSMQHATGLYQRMKNLSTPEDIRKWTLERRRRFPTKENIEKKLAEKLEKEQRGEVVEQMTKLRNRRENVKMRPKERRRKSNRSKVQQIVLKEDCETTYKGLKMFGGIDTLSIDLSDVEATEAEEPEKESYPDLNISDDDDEEQNANINKDHSIPNPLNSLSMLADYGSDSDDESPEEIPAKKMKTEIPNVSSDESPEEMPAKKIKTEIPNATEEELKKTKIEPDNFANNNNNNISVTINDKIIENTAQKSKALIANSESTGEKKINNCKPRKINDRSLQFLQKLLARDIQHERNMIFQCIKYISDNNFFE